MRRIKRANVEFISLVPRGANKLPVMYKAEDKTFEFNSMVKADMDKGEILACVYAPNHEDTHGEGADAEVIQDAAHRAMRNGIKIDLRHDGRPLTKEQAFVAESFIIQAGDSRFAGLTDKDGAAVDATGGWGVLLKINDPDLRMKYRNGVWQGVSMGGSYELAKGRRPKSSNSLLRALAEALGLKNSFAHHSVSLHGDVDMTSPTALTKEDLNTFKADLMKEVAGTVKTLIKEANDDALAGPAGCKADDSPEVRAARITLFKSQGGKPATSPAAAATGTPATPEKPVFKGNMAKAEDVAAFDLEVKRWEIMSKVDKSDPAALKKAQEELAALEPKKDNADLAKEEQEAGIEANDNADVRRLKLELAKAKRGSNQNNSGTPAAGAAGVVSEFGGIRLSKEDREAYAEGLQIAKVIDVQRKAAIPA